MAEKAAAAFHPHEVWVPTQHYAELVLADVEGKRWNVHGNAHNLAAGYIRLLETLRTVRVLAEPWSDKLLTGVKRTKGDRLDDILVMVQQALPEDDAQTISLLDRFLEASHI